VAWGLIDGIMYLMACLSEGAHKLRTVHAVRGAAAPEEAHRIIVGALPALVAPALQTAELERMRLHLLALPDPPRRPGLSGRDWFGSLAVFLLVFLSTFPVVLPFAVIPSAHTAMRVSNGVAIVMLFLTGYAFGRCSGYNGWFMGIAMVLLGLVLVGITIALGG